MLRLVWSNPMSDLDRKWLEVKNFYEMYYRDSKNRPVKFNDKPPEEKILELHAKMKQVAEELESHHFFHKFK